MIKRLLFILKILLLPIILFSQSRPTTEGINQYVFKNSDSIISEFNNFFHVNLYDMSVETGDLREYGYDKNELGLYDWNLHIITINNEEKFSVYSLKDFKKTELKNIIHFNNSVRGSLIHEIAHGYTDQISDSLNFKEKSDFGTIFLKEGVAEYCSLKLGEVIINDMYIPSSIEELQDQKLLYEINYNYSYFFVRNILDTYGLTNGIILFFKNPPPTDDEILNPIKYYTRIKKTF